jgi:glutamate dehydrogenase/leucine dehydrogenase
MGGAFRFVDELGPWKVLELSERSTGLRAFVVVDNVALGPAIGGVRFVPEAGVDECFRLARAMTLKNAVAELPHGGAKSVIVGDPAVPAERKEAIVRAFAAGIADLREYVPGPDMGTDEVAMAWVCDETGRAAGLPRQLGGIPIDEIGATGFGVCAAAEATAALAGFELAGARVAVQGFGAVGRHAARFLAAKGARLVAAADSSGAVHDQGGLDVEDLVAHKAAGRGLAAYPAGERLDRDAVVEVDCEILVPAARPDVLHAGNAERVRARLVVEGANIPTTAEADAVLDERGTVVVPDIIANAGGVIAAATEYVGGTEETALAAVERKVGANSRAIVEEARRTGELPRAVANRIARERVLRAMEYRRFA